MLLDNVVQTDRRDLLVLSAIKILQANTHTHHTSHNAYVLDVAKGILLAAACAVRDVEPRFPSVVGHSGMPQLDFVCVATSGLDLLSNVGDFGCGGLKRVHLANVATFSHYNDEKQTIHNSIYMFAQNRVLAPS